jgi:hypothetical protein
MLTLMRDIVMGRSALVISRKTREKLSPPPGALRGGGKEVMIFPAQSLSGEVGERLKPTVC